MSTTTHNIAENLSAAIDEIRAAAKRLVKWWQCRPPIIQYTAVYSLILTIVAIGILNTFALNLVALGTFLYLAHQAAHIIHNRKFLKHIWIRQNDYTSTLLHYQALKALATDQQLYPLWLTKRTSWKHHQQQPKLNSFPSYSFPQISIISAFLFCLTMLIIQAEIGSFLPTLPKNLIAFNVETNKEPRGLQKYATPKAKAITPKGNTQTRINQYDRHFNYYGNLHGVDPAFLKAIATQESAGNKNAVGPMTRFGTAKGLMQFIDPTAKAYKLKDPFNAEQAIEAGAKYQKFLLKRYKGNTTYAAAAYNWGEGNLDKYGLKKMPRETRNYIKKVAGYHAFYHTTTNPRKNKASCQTVESGKGHVTDKSHGTCIDVKLKIQTARMMHKLNQQGLIYNDVKAHLVESDELTNIAKQTKPESAHVLDSYQSKNGDIYIKITKRMTPVTIADRVCSAVETIAKPKKCSADLLNKHTTPTNQTFNY